MNFLEKYEKKYLPNFHAARYKNRISRVLDLKKKWKEDPQSVGLQDLRMTLRVLKYKQILPFDQKHQELEAKFFKRITTSLFPSMIFGLLPWLIRETYNLSKYKKRGLFITCFLVAYGVQIKDQYYELQNHNRKLARKYVEMLQEQNE